MNISDILPPALIKVDLRAADKEEAFEEMVSLLVSAGRLRDRRAALDALREREAKMTTGIGNGLALPHGKTPAVTGLAVALALSRDGVEYDAMDGQLVHTIVMVLAEINNPGPHIEALAEVSRLFSLPGFGEKLRDCRTSAEVLELIRRQE